MTKLPRSKLHINSLKNWKVLSLLAVVSVVGVFVIRWQVFATSYDISCTGDAGSPTAVTESSYTSSDDITFSDGGDGYCVLDAPLTVNSVTIASGVTLTHTATDTDGVTINAATISVAGTIDVEKRGCTSTEGPDASNVCSSQASTTADSTPPGGEGADPASGWGSGAGYGATGGSDVNSVSGGSPYGLAHYPDFFGSGGGRSTGGKGGGMIKLITTGNITIDGSVKSNGSGGSSNGGGGSGGSIYIYSGGTLSGSGTITANGGDAGGTSSGRGAGGRIAVYYQAGTPTTLKSNATANAGSGTGLGGQKGTILFAYDPDEDTSPSNNIGSTSETADDEWTFQGGRMDLADLIDNTDDSIVALTLSKLTISTDQNQSRVESDVTTTNLTVTTLDVSGNGTISCADTTSAEWNWIGISTFTWADQNLTCPEIDWGVSTNLAFTGSAVITASKKGDADAMTVNANSSGNKRGLTLSDTSSWVGNLLYENATTLTLNTGTSITANTQGCLATKGPDSSNVCQLDGSSLNGEGGTDTGGWGGGAGHGGAGGAGVNGGGAGSTYGSSTAPVLFGSGGGNSGGGVGGGKISITTTGNVNITGDITADGGTPSANHNGGGSGGSIYLQIAGELAGTGNVTAKGGSSSADTKNGAGGGGRIAIKYITLGTGQTVTSNLSVAAGTTGGTAGAGTTNTSAYAAPTAPSITAPTNGATSQSRGALSVTTSAYSGDLSHTSSDWNIATDSGFSNIVWTKSTDTSNLTSITVNSTNGTFQNDLNGFSQLAPNTTYYVRARHTNAVGSSSYSSTISFTTAANVAPSTPTNSAPSSGATGVSKNPTLSSSTFSNSDNDTQKYSDWAVYEASDCSGTADWSKSNDTTNLTSITVNTTNGTFADALSGKTTLKAHTVYSFQVRYSDWYGSGTSAYSTCTSFTTTNTAPALDSSVPNQSLTEDNSVTGAFDLDTYFSDVDFNDDDNYTCTASNDLSASLGTMTINSNRTVDFTLTANANGSDTIQFSCQDGGSSATASNAITVTVAAVNDTPSFSGTISNQTTNEDTNISNAFDLDSYFTDVDSGDTCTYSAINDFSMGTMSISSGAVSFTLTANANGTDTVQFRCTDGSSATADSNTVTITVTAVNDSPTFTGTISNQTTNEDTSLSNAFDLDSYFSDVDTGDTCTYSVVDDFSKGTMSISSGAVSFTPTANANGSDTVQFKCTDGSSAATNTNSLTVTVTAVNDAPTFSGTISNQSTNEDTNLANAFDLDNFFTDVDTGDSCTYTITDDFSKGTMTISSGAVSFALTANATGSDTVQFRCTDGSSATANSNSVTVTIAAVNDTPVVSGPVNITIEEGTKLVILVDGTDSDGDSLDLGVEDTDSDYAVQGITVGNLFTDAGDNSGVFEWTPAYSQRGDYATTFTASDTAATGSKAITVTVTDVNSGPAFSGTLPSVSFVGGTTTAVLFDLDDYFSDADGDTLTYAVAGNTEVAATITDGEVMLTAPAAFSGTEALTFSATDAANVTEYSNAMIVTVASALSLETVDHVEGTSEGEGIITVVDESGSEVSWSAFPVGGAIPRIGEINGVGYVFVTKYRSGSTIHVYTLTGELLKKKRLSPQLHWRKLATGDLDNRPDTEEIVVATRRDSKIYFKIYEFKPARGQFHLLRIARTGRGPVKDHEFEVSIKDSKVILKDSGGETILNWQPFN